jgi:hypothetical protein
VELDSVVESVARGDSDVLEEIDGVIVGKLEAEDEGL